MVTKASWVAGLGQGLAWGTAINSADMASMATANSVLSSVADIANGTALDMFMDLSAVLAIASSTIASGANLAFWLYALQEDGTTYGDGQLTAGTAAAKTPTFAPCAVMPLIAAAAQTTLVGFSQQLLIPPGSFRLAIQNNSGFTLTAGTQTVKYRTYNIAMT
ncbi:MAG TPA: hypothetical protein VIO16_06025 [Dehalococcoidia bacterium]